MDTRLDHITPARACSCGVNKKEKEGEIETKNGVREGGRKDERKGRGE